MQVEVWSWILIALGIASFWIVGSGKNYGWLVGVSSEFVWLVYAIVTQQYGFIPGAFLFGVVYARNYIVGAGEDRGSLKVKINILHRECIKLRDTLDEITAINEEQQRELTYQANRARTAEEALRNYLKENKVE
jgi:hypothetical protein